MEGEFDFSQLKQMDRGILLFCFNAMIDSSLIYGSISIVANLLVSKYGFDDTLAGSLCLTPYLVYILVIPVLAQIQEKFCFRMKIIYMMGISQIASFGIWLVVPESTEQSTIALVPLVLLGMNLAVMITLLQTSIPYVVKESVLGTAMGLISVFQNFGFMVATFMFNKIHDDTIGNQSGYFWSIVFYMCMACVSMGVKVAIGEWDKKRGSILDSRTPSEDFLMYQRVQEMRQDMLCKDIPLQIDLDEVKQYNSII